MSATTSTQGGSRALPITLGAAGAATTIGGVVLAARATNRIPGALLAIGGLTAIGAALVLAARGPAAPTGIGDPGTLPTDPPTPEPTPSTTTTPSTPPPVVQPTPVRIGQLNAHNLFDTTDGYGSDTVLTQEQYDIKLGKLGLAIRDAMHAPDVIALQEVENLHVLEDLAARPEIAAYGYRPILVEGTDPRGIDVAYLYRPDRVELVGSEARGTTRRSDSGRNVQLFTRPPLVATFRVRPQDGGTGGAGDAAAGATFTVINNHFTSKLQGASGAEKRRQQAEWVARLASGAEAVTNLDPDRVVVLGDLNSTIDEDAYSALVGPAATDGGTPRLVNAASHLPEPDRYSWRDGSQRLLLDHVLLTPTLDRTVQLVELPHVNSEASPRLEQVPGTAARSSDHDPVIVTLAP